MDTDALEPAGRGLVSFVVAQIMVEARRGAIPPGGRLPSERTFAERLRVSRNTVTAAYSELERRGAIRKMHGKGSFLRALPTAAENFSWSGKVANTANALDEPVLELLARRCAGDIAYPLSAGTPSLAVFPRQAYAEAVQRTMAEELPGVLAVAPTEGQWRLREALGAWLGVEPQQVMVTAGAQEGIDLLARCLVEPGDTVVVESPTYAGAIQSFRSAGARLLPWGTDWSLDALEILLLRHRPKLLFVTPSFQNPTGRVMDGQTREGLLELAYRYRVPVIEDDVYSQLYFGQAPPAPLFRLDRRSQVIALSTFSKMLAPGLRIGWLVAPRYMVKQLSLIKMRSNLFTGGLNQVALAGMVRGGQMNAHLREIREHHAMLCRVAMGALQPLVEEGLLQIDVPEGGLYLWCRPMADMDMDAFHAALEQRGLSVAPGTAFAPVEGDGAGGKFRICFTACPPEPLRRGLGILAAMLRKMAREDGRDAARMHSHGSPVAAEGYGVRP